MDDRTLDDLLSDEPTTEASEPEAPSTETSERPRDPATGKFVSASDPGDENPEPAQQATEAAPPAASQDEPGHIPVAALRDERQRRQTAEEEARKNAEQLRQYEAYFQSLQQQQQPQPQAPDPNEDFAGWLNWRDQQIAAQIRDTIMQEVTQYGDQFRTTTRAEVSELQARQRHQDYDQVIDGSFKEAVAANPFLVSQLAQAQDPAEFAYNAGKQWAASKAYGSEAPPSRDEIVAQVRAEIMAELGVPQSQRTAPSSLASERSVGTRSAPAWPGPPTLNELLG